MNKILCIYPKDSTTEFLRPIYNTICAQPNAIGIELNTVEDDSFLEKVSRNLENATIVFFLGHGSSTCLYGTNLNPLIEEDMGNVEELQNKSLILFACKSADFIKKYNFQNSLGFGFIPTSLDDARDGMLHNLNLKCLDSSSLDALQQTIVRIWKRTLKEVSLDQLATLSKVLSFYTNYEIVHILLHCKDFQNYRILADILYYLKEDMRYFPIKNY